MPWLEGTVSSILPSKLPRLGTYNIVLSSQGFAARLWVLHEYMSRLPEEKAKGLQVVEQRAKEEEKRKERSVSGNRRWRKEEKAWLKDAEGCKARWIKGEGVCKRREDENC